MQERNGRIWLLYHGECFKMISGCRGCEWELGEIEEWELQGLYYAGSGLYEKGHLRMIIVDEDGKVIVE